MSSTVAWVATRVSANNNHGEVANTETADTRIGVCAAGSPSDSGVVDEEADPSRPRRDLTVNARRAVPTT